MNGVIVVDKPAGKTSQDVVTIVKKMLGIRKAGHTGTLDPLATGVLPVCLNEATKLSQFLSSSTKDYRATMLLGLATDTQDIEGKTIAERDPAVTDDDIRKALNHFIGTIEQKPPEYSAVKYKGKPLYKWAREGVMIDTAPRTVHVYDLVLENVSLPFVTFTISCSAGTYIRSICAGVGEYLGCGACLSDLRRLRSGTFQVDSAVMLDDEQILKSRIIPMTDAVAHLPAFIVNKSWGKKLTDGVQPDVDMFQDYDISFLVPGDMIKFISEEGRLVAIASVDRPESVNSSEAFEAPVIKIARIFHDQ